jgi:hypothetical protein
LAVTLKTTTNREYAIHESNKDISRNIHKHLPDENWFDDFFDYIQDRPLSNRIAEEFKAIRYIYKFLEGIQADEWLKNAQISIQIIYYASIYEAKIHYVLFDLFPTNPFFLHKQPSDFAIHAHALLANTSTSS